MFINTIRSVFLFFLVQNLSIKVCAQTIDSAKIKIPFSVDSTKNVAHAKIDSGLVELKTNIVQNVNGVKPDSNTLKKFLIPVVKGRVGLEAYHTTFQNPRMLNEPQYLRLSGNTSVSLGGLPFLVDFYKTSEKQTLYNSNYIKAKFDYQTFINGITKQWEQKLQAASSSANMSKYQSIGIDKLNTEMEQQKGALNNQQALLEAKLKEQQEAYIQKYKNQADSFAQGYKDSLTSEIGQRQDSMTKIAHSKSRLADSMQLERIKNDTHRIAERMRQIEAKKQELQDNKKQLDSTIAVDTAKYNYYKNLLENPEANASAWLKEQDFPSQLIFLSKLKDFQTGIINPFIHNYSISGVSMKGIQSSLALGKNTLNFTGGKAIIADFSSYNRTNNKYERMFVGAGFDWKINKNISINIFGHFASDPKNQFTKENRLARQNGVLGFEALYQPNKWPKLDISYAKSTYKTLNNIVSNSNYVSSGDYSFAQQTMSTGAYKILAEKNIIKGITLEGSTQMVGPRFKNLGNPFMRVNFMEHIAKTKFVFFKNQINASAFYKTMRDNPLKINEVTNTTSGYGLSMNTHFKNRKLPNFMASVSPYEQGNNHPDSLFRVNSKFSIITAGITYRTGRRSKYFIMVYGSQSRMQFTDTFFAIVRTLTVSQDLSLGKRLTIGMSSTFTRTFPSVDSTQANIHQARISYRIGKSTSITLTGFSSQFLNGAYRKGGSLTISAPTGKHLKISLKAGYDHYYKLWGIDNKEAIWGMCRLDYMF